MPPGSICAVRLPAWSDDFGGDWPRTDPSIPLIKSSFRILHAHKVGYRADTFSFRYKEEVDAGRFLLPRRRAISELPFAAAHVRRARQLAGEMVGFFAKTLGDGHVEPPRHIRFPATKSINDQEGHRGAHADEIWRRDDDADRYQGLISIFDMGSLVAMVRGEAGPTR